MTDYQAVDGYELVLITDAYITVKCLKCGGELTAIGLDRFEAIRTTQEGHDAECADLKAASALLDAPEDKPAELESAEAEIARLAVEGSSRIVIAGAEASLALAEHTASVMDAVFNHKPFGGDAA